MKRLLGILTLLCLALPIHASVTVSPTRIEINANKIKNNYVTTAVEIKGDTTKAVRYRAYPGYFKISDKGEMIMLESGTDEHDISGKIRFVPSEFTVPPGKAQKVRVNIANIKTLPDGESRAILYLEDVNTKELSVPYSGGSGIGAQLLLKTRVGVPVYVDKGNFKKNADIEYFKITKGSDGLYTEMKILSTGNSKIRYSGMFQIVQGKKLICEYPVDGKVVGDNNSYVARQKIETSKVKEPGEYTLRLVFSYFDEKDNRKNIKKDAILNIKNEI